MKDREGFTLIELLIIVIIIGLLAAVILISLSSAREKANIASYKSQVASLVPALLNACNSVALTSAVANNTIKLEDGNSSRKIVNSGNISVTASSCGPNNAGTFTATLSSIELGRGVGANACEVIGSTIIKETGVITFPAGC